MASVGREQIIPVIREIEAEYKEAGGDLFLYLFNYFFPKIDTKSDYCTDDKGRYLCQCDFVPNQKESVNQYALVAQITELFKEITAQSENPAACQHTRLGYAGSDTDADGNKINIQVCLDCDEVFEVGRHHP